MRTLTLAALLMLSLATPALAQSRGGTIDRYAYEQSCDRLLVTLQEMQKGVLTPTELRAHVQGIYTQTERASYWSPELQAAGARLMRAVTTRPEDAGQAAVALAKLCDGKTSAENARAWRARGQIAPEEADRLLRGVLERGGTPAAKCSQKQYGTGWVTVCE